MATTEINTPISGHTDPFMERLLRQKRSARIFQERKHDDWNSNYELNRNKIRTNRLTQRQAVNIPLMKETEKTILSNIDDAPKVDWKELGGDEMKELTYQQVWDDRFETSKFEWKDIMDKKNVLRYGLGTKKLVLDEYGVDIDVPDVFDILYDPLMNPMDVETARFIIHQNIFRTLSEILADPKYRKEGKDALSRWVTTKEGIVQSAQNKKNYEMKLERIKAMGVEESDIPHFAAGDVIVNLSEHFTQVWDTKAEKFERRVVVYADDQHKLYDDTLQNTIGVDFWPFDYWAEDPETNDIYPDSIDDVVRTPNKIINVWFSQLIENRTLQNFQMHWYDATIDGYKPQTYEPGAGRMLPAPGDPNKTIMPVNVNGLDETMNAIDFVIRVVERASGASATEKGVGEKKQITLGEVELLVGKAMERTVGMAKFYRGSWAETCRKWTLMMHANPPRQLKLSKVGVSGRSYSKTIFPSDWKSSFGYKPIVSSTSEQEEEQAKGLQKWQAVLGQFPNNPVLRRIGQKRMMSILDLTPEEIREVQDAEKEMEKAVAAQNAAATGAQGAGPDAGGAAPSPFQDAQSLQTLSQ